MVILNMGKMKRKKTGEMAADGVMGEKGVDWEPITREGIEAFLESLRKKKRGESSLDHYRRSLTALYVWLPEEKRLYRDTGTAWRRWLLETKGFCNRTVNTYMSVLNGYLRFLGHRDWQVEEFVREADDMQPELSRAEYLRLLSAAKKMGKEKSYLLIKTMGGAGVRVQELSQVTVEAVAHGMVCLDSHNGLRLRVMRIPKVLKEELTEYIRRECIKSGPVFLSREGKPLGRATVHHSVKMLSQEARVEPEKANPRCLWKMYCNTQDGIQANIDALTYQAYEYMMEKEQLTIGWAV